MIVTVKDEVSVLPYTSVAEQSNVVVPIGNVDPDVSPLSGNEVQDTGTDAPYSSIAVGVAYVSVEPDELVAVSIMFEGVPVIAGAVVPALTVIVNVVVPVLP